MPNHTTNHLRVTGPETSIAKMQEFVKSEEAALDCNSIIPMPEALRGTTKGCGMANEETLAETTHAREQGEAKLVEDFGFDNWYDWAIANWGTKWGVYSLDEPLAWEPEVHGVYMEFYSAWAPPVVVIAELARRFPDLRFLLDYSDEGGSYAGQAMFKGKHCDDHCLEDTALIEAKNREMGLASEE